MAAEVVHFLSLSVPAAIGLTIAFLAIPEARGGVVSQNVRRLALPTALAVAVWAAAQFVLSAAVSDLVVALLLAAGLVVLRTRASRPVAAAVTATAVVGAVIPLLPATVGSLDSLARSVLTVVHVVAATLWVGGLVVLGAAGMLGRRARGEEAAAGRDWAQVWERFSVVALYAVGGLIISGMWLAWTHVGTPAQLLTTAYGRYLAVKLVLVVALLGAGAYNMRVLMPRIRLARRDGDTRSVVRLTVEHFPVVVVAEAVVGVAILAVVPFLRGSARAEAGWPGAGPFDATVFASGAALVALVALALWAGTRQARFAPRGRGQYHSHGRVR
ncbi:putative copper export protein [Mycolicibacterium chubuense NBB4]|uniref:Putative copper export protein n=1 Tax=Mycolicibacterium chubuense (strain NBB4) TaxID=710421 RepID=I4BRH5_MYCCN|nr:putative copper export protein [Mycolicibacterium chubuense NBB4]